MSYIEDLRRQAEHIRLLEHQEEQKKNQVKELQEQRRKQAGAFWEESKVADLVSEVTKLLRETRRLESIRFRGDESEARVDPDSKIELFYWDKAADRPYIESVSAGMGSVSYQYDRYKVKAASVESLPDGDIVFKGNQTTRVSLEQWKANGDSFKSAMHNILSNPGNKTYHDPSSRRYYNPDPGRHISRGYPWE